ncbi:MmgE/PrpD family protein [Oscillibacter sp. MSJ-2]|uniref:MmgE/PrpD family protein n=2 Tax=Dysosmobacter acutus TaxID=2841504 RepID=A0ABS6F8T7_9FIRM|nr:MmgE/PrpD family protein [Dysosmobacter acutus]MBU5626465.1 MmgE/PrpD family protein [Dysosmobacter acutus]
MRELRTLAQFICNLQAEDIPQEVAEAAVLRVLDTVSVAVGGAGSDLIERVEEELIPLHTNEPTASLWGRNQKSALSSAIFFNAMRGHYLELDDVHTGSKTHIGTVVIPAAWGLAEKLDRTGAELIVAIICGYETMARIGLSLGTVSHRQKGWHVTGTAGTFGAAAACGKLLGLSEEKMVWALGLAGTQSSGLWAFLQDGANCKVLHPARAALNGCEAALMAHSGMSGPESILTAKDGGLLAAMSDEYDVHRLTDGLGQWWATLQMDVKPYPCCRSTHCAIDAALALRSTCSVSPDHIARILVETYDIGYKQCGMSKGSISPTTAAEAKFSTPYTAAVALLKGSVSLKDFQSGAINEPELRNLMGKITVVSDKAFSEKYPEHWGCRMTIETLTGEVFQKEIIDAAGSIWAPLTRSQQIEKAGTMFSFGGYASADTAILDLLNLPRLDHIPVI